MKNYPIEMYDYKEKEFFITDLQKWLVQNEAEIIDCFEGCLLDYYVIACKNGTCFVFEECATEWASKYHAYFFKNDHSEKYKRIEEEWYELQARIEEEITMEE